MLRKKISTLFVFFITILVLSPVFSYHARSIPEPCTVRGYVYLNEVITTPDEITLIFDDQEIQAFIPETPVGYFILDFEEENGETGVFEVTINEITYNAEETITIEYGVYVYNINLTVNTPPNQPPNKPVNPNPENNSENINPNPSLSVYVLDPDDDDMDVIFKDASDDSTIGTDTNVDSNTRATVKWNGLNYNTTYEWYAIADDKNDNTNTSDIFTFKTKKEEVNNPPNKPINPKPENNSENISINPKLRVFVTDPDSDLLTVSFYNASNDELIDTVNNVESNTNATITWSGLDLNASYRWYATANDSILETKSEIFTFKTIEEDNNPPNIYFQVPEKGSLYLFGEKIFSDLLKNPLIIGNIKIVINATDNETGISKVELTIRGRLRLRDITKDLTQRPYKYEWSKIGFGKYNISAKAYDLNGNSREISLTVRKFL